MAVRIAPGIFNEEIDRSLYIPQLTTSILGLVGAFKKGPVSEITLITSRTQFEQVFGTPIRGSDGYAAHAANYFLRWGSQMKVVRVGDGDEAKSKIAIVSSDTVPVAMGYVQAIYEGGWADGIQITMETDTVPDADGVMETIYIVKVFASGDNVATDDPLEIFTDVVFDDAADENYVEKKITSDTSLYIEFDLSVEAIPDATSTWTLAGGDDGTTAIEAADINTGIDLLADPTTVDINLLSAPGWNHDPVVAVSMMTVALARMDCLAVLDLPDLTTAANMVKYVRGQDPYTTVIPSVNRAAIYGPWVQIYDSTNKEDVWVPPSVRTLGVFAYNDKVAWPWYAAAGPNRGILYDTLDVRFKMTQGDIEATYGAQNNINPIRETVDGILIDGNKDLARKPSLLQNIHIIRMLMYAEKAIATGVRYLQWEPHDERTWRLYESVVNPFLADIAANRGITEFKVKCDADTNTAYYTNNNQMMAELHIIPTTAVEKIVNQYIIHPHGATLVEE